MEKTQPSANGSNQQSQNKPQPQQKSRQNIEIKTKEEFLNQKLNQGFVRLKVNFQYIDDRKVKTLSRKVLVHQSETLLKIQQDMKNSFKKVLQEKGIPIRPEDGIFLFIKNQKIVQMRAKIKQMTNYMVEGPEGKYLQITGTTVQKFGTY